MLPKGTGFEVKSLIMRGVIQEYVQQQRYSVKVPATPRLYMYLLL